MKKLKIKKPKPKIKTIFIYLLVAIFIAWNVTLFMLDLDDLVMMVGVHNLYLLFFFIAVTTGLSSLTAVTFYATLGSYVQLGLNPIILGIIGGFGMAIGDSIIYWLARQTRDLSNIRYSKIYKKLYKFIANLSDINVYIFVIFYTSFIPIPNDFLMVALGFLHYKYSRIIPLIILGNIILVTLVALGLFQIT